MSLASKQRFLQNTEKRLESFLVAKELSAVIVELSKELDMYELTDNDTTNSIADEEYLKSFLSAKFLEGKSQKTIDLYRYMIKRMLDSVNVPVKDISVHHLRDYLMAEKERGLADKTLAGNRDALCSFFKWLTNEGFISTNPCANLAPIKCAKKVRKPFNDVDIEKLKECCKRDRDRAIVTFLLSTGCRISELCELDVSCIDFRNKECIVH